MSWAVLAAAAAGSTSCLNEYLDKAPDAGLDEKEVFSKYANFKSVGVKLFPSLQTFKFTTTATNRQQEATVSIRMSEVKDDSKWDTKTTISSKYKKVSTDEIIKKLLSL